MITSLSETEAISRLRRVLAASGFTVAATSDDSSVLRAAPKTYGDAEMIVAAQLLRADYPDGRRTVVVFTALYSRPTHRMNYRQLTAKSDPGLWAVLHALSDTFANVARRSP